MLIAVGQRLVRGDVQHVCPEGFSGCYNVQETRFKAPTGPSKPSHGDGNITRVDGAVLLASTYATNSWLTITHYIDTESDLMHVYLNGEFLGQVPTTASKSADTFYAAGQINLPLYYLDDVIVAVADPVVDNVAAVEALSAPWPQPAQDNVRIQPTSTKPWSASSDSTARLSSRSTHDLMAGAQLSGLQNGLYLVEISNGTDQHPALGGAQVIRILTSPKRPACWPFFCAPIVLGRQGEQASTQRPHAHSPTEPVHAVFLAMTMKTLLPPSRLAPLWGHVMPLIQPVQAQNTDRSWKGSVRHRLPRPLLRGQVVLQRHCRGQCGRHGAL